MFNSAYKRERSEPYVNAVIYLTYDDIKMFNAAYKKGTVGTICQRSDRTHL